MNISIQLLFFNVPFNNRIKKRQTIERTQVHPHLIQRTSFDKANSPYVTIESNVRTNSIPLNNPTSSQEADQTSVDETNPSVNVSIGNDPYQYVVNETVFTQSTESTNTSTAKRGSNVSFNTEQTVHYYSTEKKTKEKSKAGLWLKVQNE